MVDKWVGKFAVVTGASAGIGASIFKDLAKAGVNVIGLARRSERVEALIKELGPTKGKTYAYKCDVSDIKSVTAAFKWIEKEFGAINILVNNAGISRDVTILKEGDDAFEKLNEIMDTNVRGLTQCTREAFRLMKKSDDYGLIINVNSILGHSIPFRGAAHSNYPASKYAVTAITELIRQELVINGLTKIRISSLSPGFVETEILSAMGYDETKAKALYTAMPSLKPEDISHAVLFLLSTGYNVNISELTIKPVGEKF